jgi:hypothetical protein
MIFGFSDVQTFGCLDNLTIRKSETFFLPNFTLSSNFGLKNFTLSGNFKKKIYAQ